MGRVRKAPDAHELRAALVEAAPYIRGEVDTLPRAVLAQAVRLSARTLEHLAPGHAVELRVPPFVAVQCVEGPRHTRGTPPNVVELDPRSWLRLAVGDCSIDDLQGQPGVEFSGTRAREIAQALPIARI